MGQTHFYEPAAGHGLRRDPFKAIVAPRPIGWISTLDAEGVVNLAPFSFFNAICGRPPILAFSCERPNDTLRNVQATGEFVFNLVSARLAEQMNATSAMLPPEADEMALAGLQPAPSRLVRPPRVAEAAASMECRVLQILPTADLAGVPTGSHLITGQVVGVHIDADYLKDGLFDTAAAQPMARCGYVSDYAVVRDLFDMPRPGQTKPGGLAAAKREEA